MRNLLLLLIVVFISVNEAKVWRVDKNAANKPDFTDLQTAYNAANAGDTLYVAGHGTKFDYLEIRKKIILIGPGYFLDDNVIKGVNPFSAKIEAINIYPGAENSEIIGCSFLSGVGILCNNIILKRNLSGSNSNGYPVYTQGGIHTNIVIQQCFLISENNHQIYLEVENLVFRNNVIKSQSDNSSLIIKTGGHVENNVISGRVEITGMIVENNIFIDGTFTNNNCVLRNNINITAANMNTVFTYTGNEDAKYMLKDGSLAKGAGVNGTDCGAFGGDEPYVLSGIPPIPTIYDAVVPSSATNSSGLPVKIKARANK